MRPVWTAAISGHRPASLPADAEHHIRAGVREVAGEYPSIITWLVGGAIGADALATDELLIMGERVELVLPFPVDVHTARWTRDQRRVLDNHIARAAAVHVVGDHYDPTFYFERNRILVQRADLVVAFWNGRMRGSGTANTIRLADQLGRPVIWFSMAA